MLISIMIADFPNAKKQVKKVLDIFLRQQVKRNSVTLSLIKRTRLFEGDKISVYEANGVRRVNKLQTVKGELFIPEEDVSSTTPEIIIDKISAVAEDMAGQMERGFFQELTTQLEEKGRVVSGNPALTPDSILQALDAVSIHFEDDDRSKPVRPTIIAGPTALDNFKRVEATASEEDKKRYSERENEILDKKYQEHMTDVESRKIID